MMHELSATSFCNEALLKAALADSNTHVYVIREEGRIVATGTLCIKHTLEFTMADIEPVLIFLALWSTGGWTVVKECWNKCFKKK